MASLLSLRRPPQCPSLRSSHHNPCSHSHRLRASTTSAQYDKLSVTQRTQLDVFIDYLLDENTRYNLTAVKERQAAHERHVLDSLTLLDVIDKYMPGAEARPVRLLDVGSGPGLPGVILAIARPNWRVTCLDSVQKRLRFVDAACGVSGVNNVRTLWGRCEDLGHEPKLRGEFDIVTARAVAGTAVLAEFCMPFVAMGGLWVAAKGPDIEEEVEAGMAAIEMLGGEYVCTEAVDSFSAEGQRTALVVRQVSLTASWLPRKPGIPKKSPLERRA